MTYFQNTGQVFNVRGTNRSRGTGNVLLDQSLMDHSVNQGGPGQKRNGNLQNLTLFFEEQLGDRTFLEISHNMQIPNSDARRFDTNTATRDRKLEGFEFMT